MYAITGITGQVGGAAAQALLAAGHPIRGKITKVAPATAGGPASGSGSSSRSIELAAGLAVVALAAIAMIGIGIRRSRASEPG